MFGFGLLELVVIAAIVLLVFGTTKIPQLGAGLGKGIRNFKRAASGRDEIDVTPLDKGGGAEEDGKGPSRRR